MERRRLVTLGVWLICSVVVWNVVFDRGVESAEERYLKAPPMSAPSGLRAIMEPAIEHAALVATVWACAVFVIGALTIAFVGRRRPPSAPQPSAKGGHQPSAFSP